LFSGNAGGWWSAADLATLYQDSAGTVPVTGADQPVARIEDKSGNGNHLLQAAASRCPILRNSGPLWWLEFDGDDDFLQAAFTFNQPVVRINALRQLGYVGTTSYRILDGVSSILPLAETGTPPQIAMTGATGAVDMAVGTDFVVTEIWTGAASKLALYNDSYVGGTGNANNPGGLTVGGNRFGGNTKQIDWYGGIAIGRLLTDSGLGSETAECRTFFGNRAGLTL
jgi:hypothetical protein